MTTTVPFHFLGESKGPSAGERSEHRIHSRVRLNCPVILRGRAGLAEAWTQDVSCDGFSCVSPVPYRVGDILDWELAIGGEARRSAGDALYLHGQARVVRTAIEAELGCSLALRILNYSTGRNAEEGFNRPPSYLPDTAELGWPALAPH